PCGPCSEIHIDLRSDDERSQVDGRELVNKDNPQVIEIWNLVFMQYNRKADGTLEPLPNKVIDTGMGFERLCVAMQGKKSNYDTDVFQPMLQRIGQICGTQYGQKQETDVAMRVVADHIRTISFAITDGQLPGNAKAGYVIRRILRRAVRYAYTFLGQREAFLYRLVPQLIADMGIAYPELKAQQQLIEHVIKEEEESFLRTLETGIQLLDKLMDEARRQGRTELSGTDTFKLYDTYGFPLDLTELILRENGFTADEAGFQAEMQQQKQRARNAAQTEATDWVVLHEGETEFVGYDQDEVKTEILRYRKVKQKNQEFYQIVLRQTPFYAEMGGQIGDTGWIGNVAVTDTKRENNLAVHIVQQLPEQPEQPLVARIDTSRRMAIANNHTATHLLHAALREVLGEHVEQRGSLVTPQGLRFDFSHFQKLTKEELRQVEQLVNRHIRADYPLQESRHTPIAEARQMGAMALFGEKYGDDVRVIRFGKSAELCGGTHVQSTGRIGSMRITSESSIAAGIRRIEAVTAEEADQLFYMQHDTLIGIRELFNNAPDLASAIRKAIDENAQLKHQVEDYMTEKIERMRDELLSKAEDICGIKIARYEGALPADASKQLLPMFRGRFSNEKFALVIGSYDDDRPSLSLFISQPLVDAGLNAGQLIRKAARHIQGGGGGQAYMATAGGKDINGIHAAVEELMAEICK
ncbi:MAG: alanine--tRNA ligase, partial [Paludibacteraceae bacterium]|nr:alanine--tRNA ligase [Paludibacteraceae bacterium]